MDLTKYPHTRPHSACTYQQFQPTWLKQYPWLHIFCHACVLFAPEKVDGHVPGQFMIKRCGKMEKHAKLKYHSMHVNGQDEQVCSSVSRPRNDNWLSIRALKQMENNLKVVESFFSIVLLCGKQGLAFCWHCEYGSSDNIMTSNEGNTLELVQLRGKTDYIEQLVKLSLICVSQWNVCWLHASGKNHWKALTEAIISRLTRWGLSLSDLQGQCYDGSSNMSGAWSECRAIIRHQKQSISAHQLSLAVVASCKIQAFKCTESTIENCKILCKEATPATRDWNLWFPTAHSKKLKDACCIHWIWHIDAYVVFWSSFLPCTLFYRQ